MKLRTAPFPFPINCCFLVMLLVGFACVNAGQAQSTKLTTNHNVALTVVLGKGIKDQIEIGMTLGDIKKHRSDLLVVPLYSKSQKLDRASGFSLRVPSLGFSTQISSKTSPITSLNFSTDRSLSSNFFNGRLSCGITFERGNIVYRDEVVKLLGEPSNPGLSNIVRFLHEGRNVLWRVDAATEILYYPSNGVSFRLQSNMVNNVTIMPITPPKGFPIRAGD